MTGEQVEPSEDARNAGPPSTSDEPDPDQPGGPVRASIDTTAIIDAFRRVGGVDLDAVRRVLRNVAIVDYEALSQSVSAALRMNADEVTSVLREIRPPTDHLVPEDEDDSIENVVDPSASDSAESSLKALIEELEALQYNPRLFPSGPSMTLAFELPAGRASRTVRVSADNAAPLRGGVLSHWRSLEKYDGVWNTDLGQIVIALRGERFRPTPRTRLDRYSGRGDGTVENSRIVLTDEESGVVAEIGEAEGVPAILLSGSRPSFRTMRRRFCLTVSGVSITATAQADALAERLTDSLFFDLDVSTGILLAPRRLERQERAGRIKRRSDSDVAFPKNLYPHAPILLYRAGRDRTTAPLIRYWSYYQVLEYFFPQHVQAAAIRQLSRLLRAPSFSPYRDEDVARAVQLLSKASGAAMTEQEQLRTTVAAITTREEISEVIEATGISQQLQERKGSLTTKSVRVNQAEDLVSQLSDRIYDIRCSIVHSKSISRRAGGPGLLPETEEDDLVRAELPLMEFLAQQALISSAERIDMPSRSTQDVE